MLRKSMSVITYALYFSCTTRSLIQKASLIIDWCQLSKIIFGNIVSSTKIDFHMQGWYQKDSIYRSAICMSN